MSGTDGWARTDAVVRRGHRVASGLAGDARFPHGTILPQLAFFRDVPGFADWVGSPYPGTINLRVPGTVRLLPAEPTVRDVAWTDAFPPENFFLSRAMLDHRGRAYRMMLYVPDPATKPDHLQQSDTMELLGPRVPDLDYGDPVTLRYDPAAIAIVTAVR